MDESNPYKPPVSDEGNARRFRLQGYAWLLLPIPFLICIAILYGSTWIGRIGLVHLLMIGPLPLGLSIASAIAISSRLVSGPWHRILIAVYCAGLFLLWSWISTTYRLNPFP